MPFDPRALRVAAALAIAGGISCGLGVTPNLEPGSGKDGRDGGDATVGGNGGAGRGGDSGGAGVGDAGAGGIGGAGSNDGGGGVIDSGGGEVAGVSGAAGGDVSGGDGSAAAGTGSGAAGDAGIDVGGSRGVDGIGGMAGGDAGGVGSGGLGGAGVDAGGGASSHDGSGVAGTGGGAGGDGSAGTTGSAPQVVCSRDRPFGPPRLVPGLNDLVIGVGTTRFSGDELTAYVGLGPGNRSDLAIVTRASRQDSFDPRFAKLLRNINATAASQVAPMVTAEGLILYFASDRGDGWGLWESTRTSLDAEFSAPKAVTPLNVASESFPYVAPSGNIYFRTAREDSYDIWMARWTSGGFARPERVSISGPGSESAPVLSPDELTIYYQRQDVVTQAGIWTAKRDTITEPFLDARWLPELNAVADPPLPAWVSPDGCRLYFTASDDNNSSRTSLYVAERAPGGDESPDGAADGSSSDGRDASVPSTGGSPDAPTTPRTCSPMQPFEMVTPVPGLNDFPSGVSEVRYSDDERTAYFGVSGDLAMASRSTRFDRFGVATYLYRGLGSDEGPTFSPDGLTMYFHANPEGPYLIYRATRASTNRPFVNATSVSELNGSESSHPMLSADGETLYFDTYLRGTSDLWQVTGSGGIWVGEPVATASEVHNEYAPVITRDELALYWTQTIPPRTDPEVRVATRTSRQGPFVNMRRVPLDVPNRQFPVPSWISPDGCRLYFRMFDDNWRSWAYVAERTPQAPPP